MSRHPRGSSRPNLRVVRAKEPSPSEALDALAGHCVAARALIGKAGTPAMAGLIDLLLFEVATAIAADIEDQGALHERRA